MWHILDWFEFLNFLFLETRKLDVQIHLSQNCNIFQITQIQTPKIPT